MEFAAVVGDRAAGDRTAPVQTAQRTPLGPVGEAGRAPEVQFAGGMQHDTVTNHHGVHVGVTGQGGEHSGGDLDGDRELADRARLAGGVGVDHHNELGSSRRRAHRWYG